MEWIILGIFAFVAFLLLLILIIRALGNSGGYQNLDDLEIKYAGKQGEKIAGNVIARLLNEDDYLLSNVKVSFEEHQTEIDKLIINSHGIYIIEVKNFSGCLFGSEKDKEWQKYKVTDAGNTYGKTVPNPLHQVKRQIWILKSYLCDKGIKGIWIKGYVYMVNENSPFESELLLNNKEDVDYAIHGSDEQVLSDKQINKILELLGGNN